MIVLDNQSVFLWFFTTLIFLFWQGLFLTSNLVLFLLGFLNFCSRVVLLNLLYKLFNIVVSSLCSRYNIINNLTWLYIPYFLTILSDSSITGELPWSNSIQYRHLIPFLLVSISFINLNSLIITLFWH